MILFRAVDEFSEQQFCSQHELNMYVLRMTGDAKMQIKDILCTVGFPEECLHPQPFRFRGEDEKLDLVRSDENIKREEDQKRVIGCESCGRHRS